MTVELKVLGPMEVSAGGRPVDIGPRMPRAVLAMLIMDANRVVSLDRLIDSLWGDEPPAAATKALQVYVSGLRKALEPNRAPRTPPEVLVTQAPGYVLRVAPEAIDVVRFEALVAEGQARLQAGYPAAAGHSLRSGLALWRGDPYGDLTFESFVQIEIARLHALRIAATESLAEAALTVGDNAGALRHTERLVAEHPLRERGWELMALALYRDGRQGEALRALSSARRTLGDELGLDPGPGLQRLEAAILAQSPTLEWSPPIEPATPAPSISGAPPADVSLGGDGAADRSSTFGRQDDLALLEDSLAQATRGTGRTVLVTGEPGIGKTNLVEALTSRASAQGWLVSRGECPEGGAIPAFWPWAGVIRDLTQRGHPDVVLQALAGRAAHVAQLVPEVKESVKELEPLPHLDTDTARLLLFEAVVGFLASMARDRPLVVVLEDLHWADAASVQLLAFLGARVRGTSIVVLGTYRPAEIGPDHALTDALAILARHDLQRIELRGLTAAQVADLIAATTGALADADLAATVQRRTSGNPFFVIELARLLHSRHELHAALVDDAVPPGVRDVVRRRVARLPDVTGRLLLFAAVAGPTFELPVLELAAGLDPEQTLEGMEAAVISGLVVEDADVASGLRFSHELVRQAVLDELISARRAHLHARVAAALEVLRGDDARQAVELAHHFYRALPATGVDGAYKAIAYALRAAEVEMGQLAHEEAERQLRRALDVARDLPQGAARDRQELSVLLRLSSLLMRSKGYAAAETGEVFTAARQLCERLGETKHLVQAIYGLWNFNLVAGRYDACRAFAERLLDVANSSKNPAELVLGHYCAGVVALHEGRLDVARRHLVQSLPDGDVLDDAWLVSWLPVHPRVAIPVFVAWVLRQEGDRERPGTLVNEALEFAVDQELDLSIVHALLFVASLAILDSDPRRAREAAVAAGKRSREKGLPAYVALNAVPEGWARAEHGEPEEGAEEIEAALGAMEAQGAWMFHTFFLALLAEAQRRAGRLEDALASVERALAFADERQERFYQAELHRLRGELLFALSPDRTAEARHELHKALDVARAQGSEPFAQRAAQSLASFVHMAP